MAWEDGETLAAPAAWLLGGAGPDEMPQPSHFSYGVAWCQLGPSGLAWLNHVKRKPWGVHARKP